MAAGCPSQTPWIGFIEMKHADRCFISPATSKRGWMDETDGRYAYRCTPLTASNTAGWVVENPFNVQLLWNGGSKPSDLLVVNLDEGDPDLSEVEFEELYTSHFGSGILTFRMPWLIRTNAVGVGVELTGPPNLWLPGLFALSGIVETWVHASSATMNWKVTQADTPVFIPKGFPIAYIRPINLTLLASIQAMCGLKEHMPQRFLEDYEAWNKDRSATLAGDQEAARRSKGSYGKNTDAFGVKHPGPHYPVFRLSDPNANLDRNEDSCPREEPDVSYSDVVRSGLHCPASQPRGGGEQCPEQVEEELGEVPQLTGDEGNAGDGADAGGPATPGA